MSATFLTDSLSRLFKEHRIVFWYDSNREFEENLGSLELQGVNVVRVDEHGSLALKLLLELEDRESHYLVYAPFQEPPAQDDWFLDIRLYSRTFYADRASLVLQELGLVSQALRNHLQERQLFLRSQDRVTRLKKLVKPNDMERELDLKMLAVVTRSSQPDISSILMSVFGDLNVQQSQGTALQETKTWSEIEKYGLSGVFWDLVGETFAYRSENPSPLDLLLHLLVSDFALGLKGHLPEGLKHLRLADRAGELNSSVFVSQWRSNIAHHQCYRSLSKRLAKELKIESYLEQINEYDLADVMTFEAGEARVIRCLRDGILNTPPPTSEEVNRIIRKRREGYWANPAFGTAAGAPNKYGPAYDAIEKAVELFELRKSYETGLSYPSAEAMFTAYTNELYRFDQLYRLFHEAADTVELQGWDILKELRESVESCYSGWFLTEMALVWGSFVDHGDGTGLLHDWKLSGIRHQRSFYEERVRFLAKPKSKTKAYVIVSDAFRFEAAEELTSELNGRYRIFARLEGMLGVLPSYTALGMAALLPRKSLSFKPTPTTDVLVNSQPSSSLEDKSKILALEDGIAVKAENLLAMSKEEGRKFVKPWRVIYVFHNQIDATGDHAASESKTFSAVRDAINELSALVRYIINNLNGTNVFVTSDHGFIFQDKAPTPIEKSDLPAKPTGTLKAKKRYLLGLDLGKTDKAWHGFTSITAGAEGGVEFWIPKGINRFHFAGGSRFIHGGAMLQEIAVPVISVKELVGRAADKTAVQKVDISLLGSVKKVVTSTQRFDFIQTEAVSDRRPPRTLLISIRDGDKLISNEVTLKFDSQSSSIDERKRSARLTVAAGSYDKKHQYSLVMRDSETQIEYERIPITIDIAFMDDF